MDGQEELRELLKNNGYKTQHMVVVSDDLWQRLQDETRDPFAFTQNPPAPRRVALWWRNRTYVVRKSDVLNLCEAELEPDGRRDRQNDSAVDKHADTDDSR